MPSTIPKQPLEQGVMELVSYIQGIVSNDFRKWGHTEKQWGVWDYSAWMVLGLCQTLTEHLVSHIGDLFSNEKGSAATNNYMLQEPHGTLTIYEGGWEVQVKRQVQTRMMPNNEDIEFSEVNEDNFNSWDECKWALNCGVQKLVYSRVVCRFL